MRTLNKLLPSLLALAVPLCTWAQTEVEPNDNTGQANTLTLGTAINGDIGLTPCGSGTSDDYFRLDLAADGRLTINTNAANSGTGTSGIRVYVYNSSGSQLDYFDHATGANGVPASASSDWECASKGTYYFRAYRLSNSVCYTYALTVSLTAPLFADDLEPNNNKVDADANPLLPENTVTEGHVDFNYYDNNADWYHLQTPGNGVLNVTIASVAATAGTVRVYVYNGGGSQLDYFDTPIGTGGIAAVDTASFTCYGAGNYYLNVVALSSCGVSYQLSWSLTAPLFANDAEPNNNKAEADLKPELPANTITEGQTDYDHYGNNADWYHLQTPGNGVLNVTIASVAAAAGTVRVYVYNGGGSQLDYFDTPIGTGGIAAVNTASFTCYGAGNYYLNVVALSSCGVSYQLSWSLTAPLFANDAEPNNNKTDADANPILAHNTITEGQTNFNYYGNNAEWYHIQTPGNGVLNVTLVSAAAGTGTMRVYVYNGAGSQLDYFDTPVGSGGVPAVGTASFNCYGQGDYYLNVQSNGPCGVSYQLSYSVTSPLFANDTEPNGTTGTALAFDPEATTQHGKLDFDYYGDNLDYYGLTFASPSPITFEMEVEAAAAGTLRVYLYNSGGSQIDYSDFVFAGSHVPTSISVNFPGPFVGNSFLRLSTLSSCGLSYRLLCNDADNDGVCNASDLCASTPNGEVANSTGCSCSQISWDDGNVCTLDACANGIVTHTFQDADGDLTCDANDGCPNDPLKIAAGACGCGNPDIATTWYADSDNDGFGDPGNSQAGFTCNQPAGFVANNTDSCPTDGNKQVPGACGCGVADTDSDGDTLADCVDPCPNDPTNSCNNCGDPCYAEFGTANPCTTFVDTDGDTTCDANDGCPNDPLKIAAGACGCGNPDIATTWYADTDNDGFGDQGNSQAGFTCDQPAGFVANNTDGCPTDGNKQVPGVCGCGVADTDSDNDGIADCNDDCPNTPGEIGDSCDDGDSNTTGDVVNGSCVCAGTPNGGGCTLNEIALYIRGDGTSNVSWTVNDQGGSPVQSGGQVYPDGDFTQTMCLANGCYRLVVTDGEGDGIMGGGYLVRTSTNERIIDNTSNFSSGSVSAISGNQTFCLPIGTDKPIFSSCDKLDWVANRFIVATGNPAVTAQYGVTNATSGYEFWFYDPNGSYSYRRFRSHATSDGYGTGATRACHFKLNGWINSGATPHLPSNLLLNVRIRGRVAGTNLEFGPACLFKLDPALAACPRVNLEDNPVHTSNYSCGVTRSFGGGSRPANRIHATPPQPIPTVASSNVRYQFRFRIEAEGVCIIRPPQTSARLVLNWTSGQPLQADKTYEVDVRVSLNGGASWCFGPASTDQASACADTQDWGQVCLVSIAGEGQGAGVSMVAVQNSTFTLYPNPNHGDQLFLNVNGLPQDVHTMSMDLFDLSGKRVLARTLTIQDGFVNAMVDLNHLAGGVYIVHLTAGNNTHTERLVIQP